MLFGRSPSFNSGEHSYCGICGCICARGREVCTNCTAMMGQDCIYKLRHLKTAVNKGECSDFHDGAFHHRNMRIARDGRRIEAA